MKKIKVVHVLNSVGGVNVHLRIILKALDPDKITNVVIHGINDTDQPFLDLKKEKVPEYKIPIQREISPIKDFISVINTIKILRKEKPDIIHAHSAKGGIIGRFASLGYKCNVLYTPHAFSYLSTSSSLKRKVYLLIEKLFKHFNSILLACSNSERQRGINEVGYRENKAITINNSIEPISQDLIKDNIDIKLPEHFICTVGRPSYQKNIEMMIEVLKILNNKFPDIHLVIMGVGEYSPNEQKVKDLIKKHNLSNNTTLIPWIEREKIFSIIKKSKLYLSTSRFEGLPYSIIEALSLSKSCVVTNCDGNIDLIKNEFNGYVIENYCAETMANKVSELLNNDKLRLSFEKNALEYFNKNFNINNKIKELENIYIANSK